METNPEKFLNTLPPEMPIDQAAARLQQQSAAQQAKQEAKFRQFDALLGSRAFDEYLREHDLEVRRRWGGSPSDLEAEMAALGAALLGDADAVAAVMRRLRPHHLGRPLVHTPILLAIAALYQRSRGDGNAVDIVTVGGELRRRGAADMVPPAYLVALIEACPGAANVNAYLDAVIETAQLRALLRLGERLNDWAAAGQTPPAQLLNFLRKAADAIEQNSAPDFDALLEQTK